jgi:hypothetical protein
MTSVQAGQQPLTGDDRGPLWRRSAFRSATSGWRDFALRGLNSRDAADGTGGPERICEADQVSRELKGEG